MSRTAMLEETKHRFRLRVEDIDKSCQGRHWPLRLAMLGWFGYMLAWYLRDPRYESWLGALNMGLHAVGHLVAIPFGEFASVIGGTALQCAVPVFTLWIFSRQGDYFAMAFSLVWLGTNFIAVGRYIGDARALTMPLASPFGGGEAIHDWNYLLYKFGWLTQDALIGGAVRWCGAACMVVGLVWGLWTVSLMMRRPTRTIAEGCSSTEA